MKFALGTGSVNDAVGSSEGLRIEVRWRNGEAGRQPEHHYGKGGTGSLRHYQQIRAGFTTNDGYYVLMHPFPTGCIQFGLDLRR